MEGACSPVEAVCVSIDTLCVEWPQCARAVPVLIAIIPNVNAKTFKVLDTACPPLACCTPKATKTLLDRQMKLLEVSASPGPEIDVWDELLAPYVFGVFDSATARAGNATLSSRRRVGRFKARMVAARDGKSIFGSSQIKPLPLA